MQQLLIKLMRNVKSYIQGHTVFNGLFNKYPLFTPTYFKLMIRNLLSAFTDSVIVHLQYTYKKKKIF